MDLCNVDMLVVKGMCLIVAMCFFAIGWVTVKHLFPVFLFLEPYSSTHVEQDLSKIQDGFPLGKTCVKVSSFPGCGRKGIWFGKE